MNIHANKNFEHVFYDFTIDNYNEDVLNVLNNLHAYVSSEINTLSIENVTNLYKSNTLIETCSLPPCPGSTIEDVILKIINKKFNVTGWPNGEMEFPDLYLNTENYIIPIDIKAVLCKHSANGNKLIPKYNNAIESQYEVINKLNDYYKNGKHSDLTKSYILYVYYTVDNNIIKCIDYCIVPTLQTIRYTSDFKFQIKSANKNTGIIKNSNVKISLLQNDNRTYNDILNDLRKIQLWEYEKA